jgi:hypothetical protein
MARGTLRLSIRQYVVWRQARRLVGASVPCIQARLRMGVIRRTCREHVVCPRGCVAGRFDPEDCDRRWAAYDQARARERRGAQARRGRVSMADATVVQTAPQNARTRAPCAPGGRVGTSRAVHRGGRVATKGL